MDQFRSVLESLGACILAFSWRCLGSWVSTVWRFSVAIGILAFISSTYHTIRSFTFFTGDGRETVRDAIDIHNHSQRSEQKALFSQYLGGYTEAAAKGAEHE